MNANRRGGIERPWKEIVTQRLADLALVTQTLHTKVYVTIATNAGLQHIEVRSLQHWAEVVEVLLLAIKQSANTYITRLPHYRTHFSTYTKQRLVVLVSDFLEGKEDLVFFQRHHHVVPLCLPVPTALTAQGPSWTLQQHTPELHQDMLVLGV